MNPGPAQKIIVFRFGQIGDTLAALPSLWVLRKYFPLARIVMLSEVPARETHHPPESVLPAAGLVDGFVKYPGGASFTNFVAAARQILSLRLQGFRTLVYLAPSGRIPQQRVRDRFFFKLCGIHQLFGFRGFAEDQQPRLPDGALVAMPHEADALLERLKRDSIPAPAAGQGCMDMQITEAERDRVANWWKQKGLKHAPSKWVAICPGAKVTSKLWPWERYGEVMRRLMEQHGAFPVVIGGKEDREIGEKLLALWGGGLCAAGELGVRESAALMASALFYLGNDTGVMHLAAAMGRPCVAVFSARDWPGRWHPYGVNHQVLRFDVPCSGCRLINCDQELRCLRGVSVDRVYQACLAVLAKQKSPECVAR